VGRALPVPRFSASPGVESVKQWKTARCIMDFVVCASPYLEAPSVDKYQFEETECKKGVIKLTARGSDFGRARACRLLGIRHSRVYRDARYVYRDGSVLFPKNERASRPCRYGMSLLARNGFARSGRIDHQFRLWRAANGRNCRSRNGVCSAGSPSSDSLSSSLTAINYRSVESFLGACERARQVVDVRERCKGP